MDFSTGTYTVTEQSTTAKVKSNEKEEESSYFLPSIGGSVLDSLPPVLEAGPWIERPIIPSWDDLEEEEDNADTIKQVDIVEQEFDKSASESTQNQSEVVNENDNGWSDTFTWNDENKEVYEIEIEQTIPSGASNEEGSDVSASVFRPGVVIDDPLLIQSIVQKPETDSADYVQDVVYRSEEETIVDAENYFSAFGTVEEVPVIEYSDYYPVVSYDENANLFEEYNNLVEPQLEPKVPSLSPSSSEPEIHCDLSILLSGISCTFNILDQDEDKKDQPSPLQFAPDSKPQESGIFEVDPPSLPWTVVQESLTVNEDDNIPAWVNTDTELKENDADTFIEVELDILGNRFTGKVVKTDPRKKSCRV